MFRNVLLMKMRTIGSRVGWPETGKLDSAGMDAFTADELAGASNHACAAQV